MPCAHTPHGGSFEIRAQHWPAPSLPLQIPVCCAVYVPPPGRAGLTQDSHVEVAQTSASKVQGHTARGQRAVTGQKLFYHSMSWFSHQSSGDNNTTLPGCWENYS